MPGLSGLVLLGLCLNLQPCRTLPTRSLADPLADYDRLDMELGGQGGQGGRNGSSGAGGCGPCEPDLCPETRGCRAGIVRDSCGCCPECANLEGQSCDPGDRAVSYGMCGTGMRCQVDPRSREGGEEEEEEEEGEAVCVCKEQKVVCATDGVTYMNMCQFREATFSRPDLKTRGRGPCKTVPIIKVPPLSQVNGTGRSLVFLCEVFAFPMALVEWRKEGRDVVLPGDDPHISVQGGPLKFEVSSWLQIEGAGLEDAGTYRCVARNNVGSVSASAVLGVLGEEELSSYLANSVSEMKQVMDEHNFH